MSNHDRQQVPAKSNGVAAEDLVKAPDLGAVSAAMPDRVLQPMVGDQWIDQGAVCDGEGPSTSGCFLADPQRLRLIIELKDCFQTAATNYKVALLELRVDKLVQKEDDLNWILSLALDLAGAHLVVSVGKALKTLRAAGATRLTNLTLDAARRGGYNPRSWSARGERALDMVSSARIDQLTKLGGDKAKSLTSAHVKDELNQADQTAKEADLAYLDQLRDGCDLAFKTLERQTIGYANDAELVLFREGMDPVHHTPGAYKQELAAKLARFRASGVNEIGRREVSDRDVHEVTVHRDTRVVFVQSMNGTKSLWYQSQEGDRNPSVVRPCDPGTENLTLPGFANATCTFGPHNAREPAQLDRPVPEEFRDLALARSEQRWGPTETIDDGYLSWLKSHGIDAANVYREAKVALLPPQLPQGSVFANHPTTPLSLNAGGDVPSNSIFAPATK